VEIDSDLALDLGKHLLQGVAVIGSARQGLDMGDELAAFLARGPGGSTDLDPNS